MLSKTLLAYIATNPYTTKEELLNTIKEASNCLPIVDIHLSHCKKVMSYLQSINALNESFVKRIESNVNWDNPSKMTLLMKAIICKPHMSDDEYFELAAGLPVSYPTARQTRKDTLHIIEVLKQANLLTNEYLQLGE